MLCILQSFVSRHLIYVVCYSSYPEFSAAHAILDCINPTVSANIAGYKRPLHKFYFHERNRAEFKILN